MQRSRSAVDTYAATSAADIVLQGVLKLAHGLSHAQITDVLDDVSNGISLFLAHYRFG